LAAGVFQTPFWHHLIGGRDVGNGSARMVLSRGTNMTGQTIPEIKGTSRTLAAKLRRAARAAPNVLGGALMVLVMYLITISLITDTPILKVINYYYDLLK
jgi:hypothetical protein